MDDHALVREGICELLAQHPDIEVVGQAGCAADAIELAGLLRPEVAIVDIRLPDRSGLSVAAELSQDIPATRVLMVSAFEDTDYVVEALSQGAAGYLLKTADGDELADAVRAAAAGAVVLEADLARALARRDSQRGGDELATLTARETEVMEGLTQGKSNKQIAASMGIGVRTVEGHLTELFAKLGVASRTEAALWAVHHGITSPGDSARQAGAIQ